MTYRTFQVLQHVVINGREIERIFRNVGAGSRNSGKLFQGLFCLAPINANHWTHVSVKLGRLVQNLHQAEDVIGSIRCLSGIQGVLIAGFTEGIDTGRNQENRLASVDRTHLP